LGEVTWKGFFAATGGCGVADAASAGWGMVTAAGVCFMGVLQAVNVRKTITASRVGAIGDDLKE
jgi:hypothetical protein